MFMERRAENSKRADALKAAKELAEIKKQKKEQENQGAIVEDSEPEDEEIKEKSFFSDESKESEADADQNFMKAHLGKQNHKMYNLLEALRHVDYTMAAMSNQFNIQKMVQDKKKGIKDASGKTIAEQFKERVKKTKK